MIPIIGGQYLAPYKPINNITPFTYRDGQSYLETLEAIRTYVNSDLVVFINENFTSLANSFETEVATIVASVDAAIAAYDVTLEDKLTVYTASIDAAVANVNASVTNVNNALAVQSAAVDAAIAANTLYVDGEVATIIGNSITAQDSVVAGLVNDNASDTSLALDAKYGQDISVSDTQTAIIINDVNSITRSTLDDLFASITLVTDLANVDARVVSVEGVLSTGRLSTTTLDTRFNEKANTVSPTFTGTPVGITKAHVGLSNVDNLSDINQLGLTRGVPTKNYKKVSGVIRRITGAGTQPWEVIDDANHAPTNILSVVADATKVRITFNFTATKVSTAIVTPDESFAGVSGFRVGASVGLTYMDIYCYIGTATAPADPRALSTAGANLWIYSELEVPQGS